MAEHSNPLVEAIVTPPMPDGPHSTTTCWITVEAWTLARSHALHLIRTELGAHPDTVEHWARIVYGKLPDGFRLID